MFRLPKTSSQSPGRKLTNTVANPVVSTTSKQQGLCKFSHRKCNFVCLDNYNYCLKHILEDKSAPYKPCTYLYTVSGKKCGKPALRQDRKDTWYCGVHYRKTHLQRQRALSRHAPPKTQEALFATLGHYVPPELPAVKKEEPDREVSGNEKAKAVDPFVDIDASQVNNRVNQVLDYISESDSDVETAMLDSVWRAQDHESSDAESVDSQNEDPLKHAGTYTAEEGTIIIKDKMLRLQSLYIDQFRRLHHLLKEKRRKYLHAIKKEKETLCSIHDQEKQTAREQKLYQKLKALNRYHKHYGVEAILHKKALELRAQVTEGHQMRTSHKGKCAFTEGGVKCGAKTLPVTKYCRKHILEDTQQVLFRACGVKRDDHNCLEPTLNVFENSTCVYHTVLPTQPHHKLAKPQLDANETCSGGNIHPIQSQSDSAFANLVDSEELLIKEILKPADSTGKDDSVDALALSKTVSDILALAEAHENSTEMGETSEKPFVDQSIEPILEDNSKPFTDKNVEGLTSKTIEAVKNTEETITKASDENIEASCSEKENKVISPESCQKMDMEEHTDSASLIKETDVLQTSEDLVMVDMMTDVGVVEEVLEAEQVAEDSIDVNFKKDEQESVVLANQITACEHQAEVKEVECVVGSDQQVVDINQQEEDNSKQEIMSDQVAVDSEHSVEKTEQHEAVPATEVVVSEQEVVQNDFCKQECAIPATANSSEIKDVAEEAMEVDVENEIPQSQ